MPREPSDNDSHRFQGGVRHYHRHGTPASRSWDEWVGGKARKEIDPRKALRWTGIVLGIGCLIAIIVGLIVELG